MSSQDRGLVTELVYGSLRRELTLDACLKPRLKDPGKLPPEVIDALRLGTYEKLFRKTAAHAAVSEWVGVVKTSFPKLAGLSNAVLRRVDLPHALDPATLYGLPAWLYHEWLELFGEALTRRIAEDMLKPAPLWLLGYREEARESLEAQGCEIIPGPLKNTFAVRSPLPLAELEAFKKGWVQPQNPASTLPARLLEIEPGERVLDLAGGSGVKAAQLAALGARVTSIDLHEGKASRGRHNLRRLGLAADFLSFDLRAPPELEPASKVLLDAPCSGTGTLRTHPELRTRVTPEVVGDLAALQRELLASAAALTAPGGRLVYALCTLTRLESIENVRWFLQSHKDFEPVTFTSPLPAHELLEGKFILPHDTIDGFFIGVFRRA